jgi:hypothetical protein
MFRRKIRGSGVYEVSVILVVISGLIILISLGVSSSKKEATQKAAAAEMATKHAQTLVEQPEKYPERKTLRVKSVVVLPPTTNAQGQSMLNFLVFRPMDDEGPNGYLYKSETLSVPATNETLWLCDMPYDQLCQIDILPNQTIFRIHVRNELPGMK